VDAGCSCSGTSVNGAVTVSCGQTTCGTDDNTYVCSSNNTWSFSAGGCSGVDAGSTCSCSGTGRNGPVTVSCGETTCGTDGNTYLCNSPGGDHDWSYDMAGCSIADAGGGG
jgi:hypothetical protein